MDRLEQMKDGHVRSYRSSSVTIREFADRAMCAALARPANEEPSPTTVLGGEQGKRHQWLLSAAMEPLLT